MRNLSSIVVTGIGAVSPLGNTVAEFWQQMLHTDSQPQVRDDVALNRKLLKNTLCYSIKHADGIQGIATDLALRAAREALQDAKLDGEQGAQILIGVAVGTGAGDSDIAEQRRCQEANAAELADVDTPYGVAERVAAALNCEGPSFTLSNACSASLYACAYAAELLLSGSVDAVLLIGAEGVGRVTQASFEKMMALDSEICRPFDIARHGTILGEGAAALVLERADSAAKRGARVYAKISAYASNCDAHHPTGPREDGARAEAVMRTALANAKLDVSDIDVIVPHGTGTMINDNTESMVLRRVFGTALDQIPLCPIKSKLGHGAGAAGAFSMLAAILMMRDALLPPIVNQRPFQASCDLRFVVGAAQEHKVSHALINAYAFGGNNISMIVGAVS